MTPDLQRALICLEAGDWTGAHRIVQNDPSTESAWIHAHLHRIEGDLGNAAYWYRAAGRPAETTDLETERRAMVESLRKA